MSTTDRAAAHPMTRAVDHPRLQGLPLLALHLRDAAKANA